MTALAVWKFHMQFPCGPMRGFKSPDSADRFCRGFDELRNHLYPRSRRGQNIPTNSRRQRFLQRGIIALRIMEAA